MWLSLMRLSPNFNLKLASCYSSGVLQLIERSHLIERLLLYLINLVKQLYLVNLVKQLYLINLVNVQLYLVNLVNVQLYLVDLVNE